MMTRWQNDNATSDPVIIGLDALDGEPGPARPLSRHETARIAEHLMRQLESTSRLRPAPIGRPRVPFARRGLRRWPRWILGAAGVTLATAAAALYGTHRLFHELDGSSNDPDAAPSSPSSAAIGQDGRPIDVVGDALDRDDQGEPRTGVAHESRQADDHLAKANALRGTLQYREALDHYLYVVSEYPDSLQSRAAQLAAAAIRLEQLQDIDGAEELYSAVRKTSDGELAAQAAFGLAEVARARADRSAEAGALREFLVKHASHPLAAAARRRLERLESP